MFQYPPRPLRRTARYFRAVYEPYALRDLARLEASLDRVGEKLNQIVSAEFARHSAEFKDMFERRVPPERMWPIDYSGPMFLHRRQQMAAFARMYYSGRLRLLPPGRSGPQAYQRSGELAAGWEFNLFRGKQIKTQRPSKRDPERLMPTKVIDESTGATTVEVRNRVGYFSYVLGSLSQTDPRRRQQRFHERWGLAAIYLRVFAARLRIAVIDKFFRAYSLRRPAALDAIDAASLDYDLVTETTFGGRSQRDLGSLSIRETTMARSTQRARLRELGYSENDIDALINPRLQRPPLGAREQARQRARETRELRRGGYTSEQIEAMRFDPRVRRRMEEQARRAGRITGRTGR